MRILSSGCSSAAIFFTLFAFALNNQQDATVHWFFGTSGARRWSSSCWPPSRSAARSACFAMVPSWWRHAACARRARATRRRRRRRRPRRRAERRSAPAARWTLTCSGCCGACRSPSSSAGSPRASTCARCAARTAHAPKAYYKGLNFLLNEQQDKAIDAFIEAVQHDPDTSELHFALGNLFRRRGEYERAVRVHEHLLSRADLPKRRARPRPARAGAGLPEGRPARPRRGGLARSSKARAFDDRGAAGAARPATSARATGAPRSRSRSKLERRGTGSFAVAHRALLCELALEADAARPAEAADAAAAARPRGRARRRARPRVLAGQRAAQRGDARARRCDAAGRR